MNGGEPLALEPGIAASSSTELWIDRFTTPDLDLGWYRRSTYSGHLVYYIG